MNNQKERESVLHLLPDWLLSDAIPDAASLERAAEQGIERKNRADQVSRIDKHLSASSASLPQLVEATKAVRTALQTHEKSLRDLYIALTENSKNQTGKVQSALELISSQINALSHSVTQANSAFEAASDQMIKRDLSLERRFIGLEDHHKRTEIEFKKLETRLQMMEALPAEPRFDRIGWIQLILSLAAIALLLANLTISVTATDGTSKFVQMVQELM